MFSSIWNPTGIPKKSTEIQRNFLEFHARFTGIPSNISLSILSKPYPISN
jgi:hypothetical protein